MPLAPSLAKLGRFPLALHGILRGAYRTSLRFPAVRCAPDANLAPLAKPPDYKERPTKPMHFTSSDSDYRGHSPADEHTESYFAREQATFPSPSKTPKKLQKSRATNLSQAH